MKLLSLTPLPGATILGMRVSATMVFRLNEAKWAGWSFHIRGPLVFIETPPGWQVGSQARVGTERQVGQLPISQCYLEWRRESGDTLEQTSKYSIDVPEPKLAVVEMQEAVGEDGSVLRRKVTIPPPVNATEIVREASSDPTAVPLAAAEPDDEDDRPPQYRKKGK